MTVVVKHNEETIYTYEYELQGDGMSYEALKQTEEALAKKRNIPAEELKSWISITVPEADAERVASEINDIIEEGLPKSN